MGKIISLSMPKSRTSLTIMNRKFKTKKTVVYKWQQKTKSAKNDNSVWATASSFNQQNYHKVCKQNEL